MRRLSVSVLFVMFGCNPFAPSLEDGDPYAHLLGDPTTIDGYFTAFQSAYELRDITLYEPLIDSAFVFLYTDFDAGIEREWSFIQELETTRRLLRNAVGVQLQWNQVINQQELEPHVRTRVVRSFNLTVSLEGGEVFRGDGNVNFLLVRNDSTDAWRLQRWRDESEL